jgi:hypothetical protein
MEQRVWFYIGMQEIDGAAEYHLRFRVSFSAVKLSR